jgi:hypothetical protein
MNTNRHEFARGYWFSPSHSVNQIRVHLCPLVVRFSRVSWGIKRSVLSLISDASFGNVKGTLTPRIGQASRYNRHKLA